MQKATTVVKVSELDAGTRSQFEANRANFLAFLMKEGMYCTASLFGMCQVKIWAKATPNEQGVTKQGYVAAIECTDSPVIYVAEETLVDSQLFTFLMLHELRHLPQFAYVSRKELRERVSFPEGLADSDTKKEMLLQMFSNRAADMALHEDLLGLLGKDNFNAAVSKIQALVPGWEKFEPCVVPEKWPRNQSWITYMRMLIDEADNQQQDDGKGESSKGAEGESCKDSHGESFDEHMAGEGTDAEQEKKQGNLRDILARAEQQAKELSNKIGTQPSDSKLFLPEGRLSDEMRSFISRMRVKLNRIADGVSSRRYAYTQINRMWPTSGLPGHKRHIEKTSGIVVVLDTSGSVVGTDNFLKELRPVLLSLEKSFKVRASYSCDTELNRLKESAKEVVGGGGTQLDGTHVAKIREELGLADKEVLSLVYVTDGYVDLRELRNMADVDFHPMILPNGNTECLRALTKSPGGSTDCLRAG